MENKILSLIKKIGKVRMSVLHQELRVSRQYLNRIINNLLKQKKIIKFGKTHNAEYYLNTTRNIKKIESQKLIFKKQVLNQNLHEHEVFINIEKNILQNNILPKNIKTIIEYAFTEMLNNAIDHSQSKGISLLAGIDNKSFFFEIIDRGIGIFNNIKTKKYLKNETEALQDLIKGKQTTLPQRHSGEGIFFTSKVADKLIIESSNLKLTFDNLIDDIFVEEHRKRKGTRIRFEVSTGSLRQLNKVFQRFTSKNYDFNKSEIKIKLYNLGQTYLSRSQAKRVVAGLEKFSIIILDFDKINTIGQGFADEIFRVWQSQYPGITISYTNANKNVKFMINHVLNSRFSS